MNDLVGDFGSLGDPLFLRQKCSRRGSLEATSTAISDFLRDNEAFFTRKQRSVHPTQNPQAHFRSAIIHPLHNSFKSVLNPPDNRHPSHSLRPPERTLTHPVPHEATSPSPRKPHLTLIISLSCVRGRLQDGWDAQLRFPGTSHPTATVEPEPEKTNKETTDQAATDRRLRSRKIMLSPPIQRRFVHTLLHHNHRYRLQDPDD